MNVTGVAAVLDEPMRNRPITFTQPRAFLARADAPVIRDGEQVGTVTRAWVDGHLVRWEGHLPPPALTWTNDPDDCVALLAPRCATSSPEAGWSASPTSSTGR
ncbi:hypothetical protein OG890_39015 [Streptomyces anulatus]|uniref:hypothetical protein n=1 Tax=Streptomyces anulatus TaxID=1892 RepID=UPI00225672A2|nr:hypothetical protein [Streptomyces anulatus]MCX4489881.1 hypothetical protein [Streptomyces anulatus]